MRVATGWITTGGQFFLNEEAAKQAEFREEIIKGFTSRHSCALTGIGALVVDYVIEKYDLTRK